MSRKIRFLLILTAFGLASSHAASPSVGAPVGIRMQFVHPDNEMAYFIIDDGDSRWIPTAQGISLYPLAFTHRYFSPGKKARQWRSVSITGALSPWQPVPVEIAGESLPESAPIPASFSNSASPEKSDAFPGSVTGGSEYDKLWIAAHFKKLVPLGRLQLRPDTGFPTDFEIETTVDGGKNWGPVPSARYFHFPSPGDCVVEIPLNGVVADGVRVVSFRRVADAGGKYTLQVGGMEVFEGAKPPFEVSGLAPELVATWNNLWLTFGSARNEIHERFDPTWPTGRPYSGGMLAILATEWSLWNAKKMVWCHSEFLPRLAQVLTAYPVDEEGYVWVTTTSEKHLEHSRHYNVVPLYISAVSYYYLMTRDKGFIESRDPKTGEPILEKVRRAMRLLTDGLGGSSGLVTVKHPELQGTPDSKSNTYWDAWPFGHQDAYMNAHFYEAVGSYAELLSALGDKTEAARFHALQPVIKAKFNETFWDETNGRYIGWIDKNGKRVDFGFVFVNLEAVALGLSTPKRAEKVMEWIDGKREVSGDTSVGADIYHYKIAPRSNTLAAESGEPGYFKLFWNGNIVATKDSSQAWNLNAQNGGIILFVSYYDLHARERALGPDNAAGRMKVILEEAVGDQLRRMPKNPTIGIGTAVGILREFPESGLVPFYFVDGVMGLRPSAEGLVIAPGFPAEWKSATLRDFHFAGKTWTVTADHAVTSPRVESTPGGPAHLIVPASQTTLMTPEGTLRTQP